ncbi:uncharacterized protein LOC116341725 [Contarinia nasturtii]|uniref:uncharacterized protein LOC116341725 n=1 Tax=Contarinia nasturtii TaxID=265458 RepID=UPI0012D3CB7D|nr:uncharacterized protein LOC116341725 [Contarinia nasturtii]
MKTTLCTSSILLICFVFYCDAMAADLNKETQNFRATEELNHKIKRSTEELDSLLNEIVSDEELLNLSTLHGIDKEKVQNSPLLQYLLLLRIIQDKRSVDYKPRLGRRSESDEQPKPYDVFFTPRMGKRSDSRVDTFNYTPRLGRSTYSE